MYKDENRIKTGPTKGGSTKFYSSMLQIMHSTFRAYKNMAVWVLRLKVSSKYIIQKKL